MATRASGQWWVLLFLALTIVIFWPPRDGHSLALTFVHWAVDPRDELPVLPDPLPLGMGDDPAFVERHDAEVRQYDALYDRGGWTRRRLELKVAAEPLAPATERQLLTALGVVTAFLTLRLTWRQR
jgi:hypothetical protein